MGTTYDDESDEERSDERSVIVHWTFALALRINGRMQETRNARLVRLVTRPHTTYLGHPSNVATVNSVNNACGTLSK